MIPWVLTDSNYVRISSQKLDPNRTIFVGGLHGMMNAGNKHETFFVCNILSVQIFAELIFTLFGSFSENKFPEIY